MKCPYCNSEKFFVKDPEDEYEVYAFKFLNNAVHFEDDVDRTAAPQVTVDTETYCDRCAWHGKQSEMKKS